MGFGLCSLMAAYGQDGKDSLEKAKEQAAGDRARSLGGQRSENAWRNEREEARPPVNGDGGATESEGNPAGVGPEHEGANAPENAQSETSGGQPAGSAQAIMYRTSSGAGSPAVLSDNRGRARDGTGNVQRATPNMAGSPVPADMNLSEHNGSGDGSVGSNEVREQEEQPHATPQDGDAVETEATSKDVTGEKARTEEKPKGDDRRERRKERRKDRNDGSVPG